MKFLAILALVLAAGAAIIKNADSTETNFHIGFLQPYDQLLQRTYISQPARPNTVQYQDYEFRGNNNTWISAVYADEVGPTQNATVWIIRGGTGYNNVTLRIQSAKGNGYYYQVEIWGR